MNKKTRSISLLTAVIMLFSAFSGITTGAYASGSGISGIIPAIQTKTGIDYTAGDVIVTGKIDGTENNNYFINLTKETFAVPAGYNIAAYSINGGTSWTAVAARAVFDAAALSKLFTRTRDVTLAFTDIYDSKARKPAANAAVVNFPEIKRRPALPTYNINYRIGADSTGITPGTWVLTERNGASSVKEGIEVAAADSAGRAPGELGYGRFYGLNGSANGIDISPLPENNRAVSSVYYIRIGALDNNDGTYTAASDSRRITVSGQPRHSSYSVNRNRKTISYGSNTYILKDDGSETPPELMEKSGTLDVSDYNGDIYLWGAESGSAPSSAIQKYSVDSTKASLDFTGETVNDLTGTLFEASVILMDDEPILGSSVGTSGITVNIMNKQYEMFAGDNFEFTALVGNSPDDLGADLMWESSNPATLSVTPPFLTTTGITHTKEVTGVSPGTVVVRAAALNDINSYDEVTITVRARPLNAIEINTASTLPAGEVGVAYSQPLSATSSFPVIWSFVSGEYPPGISLDSGVLRGTPTDPGTYFFTVEASNPAGTINPQTPAARMFSITVNPVTPRRSVTFLAYTGGDVSARLIAVGMPEIFSPHEVPVGATVRFAAVPASGYKILNWTDSSIPGQDKTVMTTGNNPVVLTASTYTIIVNPFDDGGGGTDPGILIMVDFEEIPPEEMIKVNFGVVSDSNTLGGTLSARGIVTGNTADTAMRAVDIPKSAPLITFSANPASEVNNRYEVEEWTLNGAVQSHKNNVFNHDAPQDGDTVTVKFTTITPIINAAALNAQLGAAYSETLTASGNGPFTWEIIAGSLPDGLTMSPAGVISGTPIVSGTYQFTVEAEDNFNKKAARGLSIVVGDIYTIEFFADPQAGGSVLASIGNRPLNDPVNYGLQGNNVVFTATPISSNYIFKGWTVEQQTGGGAWVKGFTTDGGLYIPPNPMNSTSAPLITYTLADLRSNIRVTAEFASTSQRRVNQGVDGGNGGISVRELPSGAFSSSPDNNFNTGTTIEFRAEPNTGYDVLKWEIDGVQVPDNTSRSYTYVVEAGNNPVVVRVFFDTLLNAPMAILNDPVLGLGLARAQFSYQMLATQWPFIIHAWEIESGELPDGLAINPSGGLISGIPEKEGTYTFTVKVTGMTSSGATDSAVKEHTLIIRPPVPVTGVALNTDSVYLSVNQTETLAATVLPDNANQEVVWTSSDSNIATVGADGTVKAVAPGTAIITATTVAEPEMSASCQVTAAFIPISEDPRNPGITNAQTTGTVGIPMTLTGTPNPGNSSNQEIFWYRVTGTGVNQELEYILNGILNVQSVGNITVRAVVPYGRKQTDFPIPNLPLNPQDYKTVQLADEEHYAQNFTINFSAFVPVTNITGIPATAVAGTQTVLAGTVSPANATFRLPITWTVADAAGTGAEINGNVLTLPDVDEEGIPVVTANTVITIRASIQNGLSIGSGYTKDFNITVTPVKASGISVSRTTLQLALGEGNNTETLTATVVPENAADKSVTWTSGNSNVASVDSAGRVTAMAVGTAVITVRTNDGSNRSAACTVTVTAEPVRPSIVTGSLPDGVRTAPYYHALSATGTAPITWEIVGGKLPGGLTMSPSGVISGTPDTEGEFTFSVAAVNIKGSDPESDPAALGRNGKEFRIKIAPPIEVTNMILHADANIIPVGQTTTVRVILFPANATNRAVIWSTDNAGYADVDANGVIIGRSPGKAVITARTIDGEHKQSYEVTVVYPPITGILLNKSSTALPIGGSETLLATVYPNNAQNRTVTWSSSSTAIATVTNGAVVGVAAGTATISASTSDGNFIATCTVTVTVPVTGITLNRTTLTLIHGDAEILTTSVLPASATNRNVTWTSSDANVATVDLSGTIFAVSPGRANITATTADGGRTAVCAVTVNARPVRGVSIGKPNTRIAIGDSETLTASTDPVNATNQNMTWSSSDTSIASVSSNGTVTGIAAGTATITAASTEGNGNFKAECVVTVHTVAVTGVSLKSSASIGIGAAEVLAPVFIPANATNKNVTWASSNPAVASVDSSGRVIGRTPGTASIVVTTADGRFTASCAVTVVTNVAVSGVTLNKNSAALRLGASETLTAAVAPANAINKNVTWTSSDPSVAAVNAGGTVTAVSIGTAVITVRTEEGGRTASCTVTVEGLFNITLNQVPGGTARISAAQARPGSVITLSSSVSDGYYVSWITSPANIIITGHSFVMPNSNVTVTPVYRRISLVSDYADLEMISDNNNSYNLRVDTAVSIPASDLSALAGRNPDFVLNTSSSSGLYQIPPHFAAVIPELGNTLSENNLRSDRIAFNIIINDKTSDRAVTDAFNRDMPQSRLISAVEFGADVAVLNAGGAGGVIRPVDSFSERVTRMIQMPSNITAIPGNWGVFRYNQTASRFEFVPHTTQTIGGVIYAVVQSTTNGVYIIAENTAEFGDVRPGEWYAGYVEQAAAKRLVQGVGGGLYDPDRNVTRAEFAQMMANALQLPRATANTRVYSDVQSEAWFYDAVMRARSAGLLERFAGDAFYPNQSITREEMAAVLAAAARRENLEPGSPAISLPQLFNDYNQMAVNYLSDIELVCRLTIMQGIGGGMFSPRGTTTRAQAATVQIRLLEMLGFLG